LSSFSPVIIKYFVVFFNIWDSDTVFYFQKETAMEQNVPFDFVITE